MSSASPCLKRLALMADQLVRPSPGLVVLIYHRVGGGTRSPIDLDVEEFAWQMKYLADNDLAVTLDEGLRRLESEDPAQGVVVTFDDGTRDFGDVAVPIMVEFGVPSLLYAETSPITTGRPNAAGLEPTDWTTLGEAVATGLVQIGSHTHNHRLLRDVDGAEAAEELDLSIAAISANIGVVPHHFAYPKAVDGSPAANREIRQRFSSAALAGGGSNRSGTDPYRLQRTPIQRSDSRRMFQAKIAGGMRLEGMVRDIVAVRRYRKLQS